MTDIAVDMRTAAPETVRNIRVALVAAEAGLLAYRPAWIALAKDALEPNIYYEWPMLATAMAQKPASLPGSILMVRRETAGGDPLLIGLLPVVQSRKGPGGRIASLQSLNYPHCFLATPLLHRAYAAAALTAIFDWLDGPDSPILLGLHGFSTDGPFGALLHRTLAGRRQPYVVEHTHQRAFLEPAEDAEAYQASAISTKKRKEYRRQRKRLGELGALTVTCLTEPGPALEQWIEDFMELEARGWKQASKVAFARTPAGRTFFGTAVTALAQQGQLRCLSLCLDGTPIAMKCNFLSADGRGAFSFKIAYDERYKPYSPGVLLELENIQDVHENGAGRWMDSCANPDHPMIDHLWDGRREIAYITCGSRSLRGRLAIGLMRLQSRRRGKAKRIAAWAC